jgi:DNA (cytosine-5)-methyltransferase 1
MKYGSVCSGIEAATVAWHPLGWVPAWFSEIEPFPCELLRHYYPHVTNLGDMLNIKYNPHYNESSIDLLVGGTPCQDFSVAGLRAGLAGERGSLAVEFCRILIEKRPRWFVWENVPGALSSYSNDPEQKDAETSDFAQILAGFSECGYSLSWRVLDAQFYGVPQRRRRIFVVGHIGDDWRPSAAVLFEPNRMPGHHKKGRKKRQSIAGTIDARVKGGGFPGSDGAMNGHVIPVAGSLTAMSKGRQPGINEAAAGQIIPVGYFEPRIARNGRGGLDHVAAPLKAQSGQTGKGDGQDHVIYDTTNITSKANGSNPQPGDPCHTLSKGAHAPLLVPCWWDGSQTAATLDRVLSKGQTMPEKNRFPAVLFWSVMPQNSGKDYKARIVEVAQPLMRGCGSFKGNQGGDIIQEGIRVRRLTPLECERLQGFPDYYTAIPGASDTARYQALGNSMAVPVMAWLGKRIDIVDKYFQNGTK